VVIALPITGEVTEKRKRMPMYVAIYPTKENGQTVPALIDCGQIRVLDIDKRLSEYKGIVDKVVMDKVNAAIDTVLQLKSCTKCETVLLPNKKHCVSCKHILIRICNNCHEKINNAYKYCPHCSAMREGMQ